MKCLVDFFFFKLNFGGLSESREETPLPRPEGQAGAGARRAVLEFTVSFPIQEPGRVSLFSELCFCFLFWSFSSFTLELF